MNATHATSIEWTHRPGTKGCTWNPIRAVNKASGAVGHFCEHVTSACANCYAERWQHRLGTRLDFKPGNRGKLRIDLDAKTLLAPLRWRKPRTIFVCSMTDLFGPWVIRKWLVRIYEVMAACPQHTFIVLTKRPEEMRLFLAEMRLHPITVKRMMDLFERVDWENAVQRVAALVPPERPLKNLWGGTSVGDQADADRFIPELMATDLAVRIVSYEPALGPVDFSERLKPRTRLARVDDVKVARLGMLRDSTRLDWILCGGESGPNARPMHPDWARSVRDQCAAAGTAFFFKQWGEWRAWDSGSLETEEIEDGSEYADAVLASAIRPGFVTHDGRFIAKRSGLISDVPARLMERVGKKRAGRLLDGVEHNEFPPARPPGVSASDASSRNAPAGGEAFS